ncbi:MAG: hypothetical protein WC536_01670 [Patescibacteria group bacterium]
MKNKTIIFVINTMTYFTILLEVVKLFKRFHYNPILYFPMHYPTIDRDLLVCKKERLHYVVGYSRAEGKKTNKFVKIICYIFSRLFISRFISDISYYLNETKSIKTFILKVKPSVIILAGDNIGYNTEIFIKVGHLLRIPSVIIPSWMAGAKEAAEAYYKNPDFDLKRPLNKLIGLLDSKWVYEHKKKKLLRWPASKILAIKLFKIVPPKPWALNSGYADIILAESKAMHRYMVREGLTEEKIKVVGSLSDDVLANNIDNSTKRKKEAYLKFNLDPQKPIILCAIPPDMLHGSRVNVCEFKSYKKLVEFWVETISKFTNYNIIISLHPSAEYKDICYIEKKWKVKIIQESIINLIPLCDIFVACISATIQWAVTCGKPVINYDVYHYNYDDYKKVDGVVTVDLKDDFIKEMSKIANDQGYFAKLEKIQKSIASEWGMLDGKSGERIIKAINELSIEMDKKGNG